MTWITRRCEIESTNWFDLPEWLARHNKVIFGALFIAGELVVLWQWWHFR